MPISVKIKDIEVDETINFRGGVDAETVARYEETIDALPPIQLVKIGKQLVLASGFHRLQALKNLKRKEAIVDVIEGDRDTALVIAAKDNVKHGRPFSQEERNNAILWMVDKDWSHLDIARVFTISSTLVSKIAVAGGKRRRSPEVQEKATRTRRAKTPAQDANRVGEAPAPPAEESLESTEESTEESMASTETTAPAPGDIGTQSAEGPEVAEASEEGGPPSEQEGTVLSESQTPLESAGDRMDVGVSMTANQWTDLLAAVESNSAYPGDYGLAEIGVKEIRRILGGLGLT